MMGRRWHGAAVLLGAIALLAATAGRAAAQFFQVSIDSTAVTGTAGKVAFDLISSDPAANSVFVSDITTDATLGVPETRGGQSTGGLFQNDPTSVSMNDFSIQAGGVQSPEFYTTLVLNLTWGTSLAFTLNFTGVANTGPIPDLFALYLLDPATGLPLYPTADPLGTSAILVVSMDPTGPCLFLPLGDAPQVKLAVQNEIAEPFNACVQGGLVIGKSKIKFSKKDGRDTFSVKTTFVSDTPLDPGAAPGGFFLLRSGTALVAAPGQTLKGNKKKTRFQGGGGGLKRLLLLSSKDQKQWSVKASGAGDLSLADTGANETLAVRLDSHTAASSSGFAPAGAATFGGSGEFKRKKRVLRFP